MKVVDVKNFMSELTDYSMKVHRLIGLHEIRERLNKLPDAPLLKYGEWSKVSDSYTWGGTHIEEFKCSECSEIVNWHEYNYCPHCGAKMEGDSK